ncbi:MAG: LysR family transcriptional regulator [Sandaracinus sp.]
MREVNLAAIDLNLLLVVSTVLEERSATRAAAHLHVGQSAVSNALRRARELFGDPLVVREPHGLSPTPFGLALAPRLGAWLDEASRLVARSPPFDPRATTRTFTLACADAITVTLVPPLLRVLARRAPRAGLRVLTLDRLIAKDGLARGEVDLLVGMPPEVPPGHDAERIYRDPLRCLVPRGSPRLTLERFASRPHVELALFGDDEDTVDRALARKGRHRRIAVSLPHFTAIPLAVLETGGVATLMERVAVALSRHLPLDVVVPPLALPALEVQQLWRRTSGPDEGLAFLRAAVLEASRASAPARRAARGD